jgi:hypothetical protein
VRADDGVSMAHIRTVIHTRASYGPRRVRALVNCEVHTGYNLKRVQRVMEMNGGSCRAPRDAGPTVRIAV